MEIPKEYYLDSLNKLEIDGQLFRSKGISQLQIWNRHLDKIPKGDFIEHRRYYSGKYNGEQFFAKQFLEPNLSHWSIKKSIEYQFQNLLILKDMECTPKPLFLNDDTVGMEYIKGDTIKSIVLSKGFSDKLAYCIIAQIKKWGPIIVSKLRDAGRGYDCSYNNILVDKIGQITFVDFDYANIRNVDGLIQTIEKLISGAVFFAKNGRLEDASK